MDRVSLTETASVAIGDDSWVAHLSDPLQAEQLAINHYRIAPGDGLPSGLHAHPDQEEVFVVLDGTAVFETCDSPVDTQGSPNTALEAVETGQAVRFAPGEFQTGRNPGDDELVVLALGAPRETSDVRIPVRCPDCLDSTVRLDADGATLTFECPTCESSWTPTDCPSCENTDLRTTVRDGDVVTQCWDCGSVFDRPPVREEW